MTKDPLQTVKLRNDFYRDNFRRTVLILLISIILNVILVVAVLFINSNRPAPRYFASTTTGQLIPLSALNNPVMTDQAVTSWVNAAIPQIFALDFLNYHSQMSQSRKFFTDYGWTQFLTAFQPTLNTIVNGQYVTKAAPTDVPVVTGSGEISGVYTWRIQVPLLVTFQKGGQEQVKNVIWSIIVQRVNNNLSDQLLGISQVIQTTQSQ